MPFIRFSKDRRGYESTYLLHAPRGGERESAILLYWFRTPPFVKVGRAALDEETIGLIEDLHPHMTFDWPRILASRPQPAEPPEPARPPRPRRREERPEPRSSRTPPPRTMEPVAGSPAQPSVVEQQEIVAALPDEPVSLQPEPEVVPPEESSGRKFVRVFDRASDPLPQEGSDAIPGRLSEPSASEQALGIEQLQRLQGRYAAAMARIARRITDPALAERLRAIAERANPDSWVTADEVKDGLAGLEDVYAELIPHIGYRRRRRRGGRRHGSRGSDVANPSEDGIQEVDEEGDGSDGLGADGSPDDSE